MNPSFLQRVLNDATPHQETQGARIEYDTASFSLSAKYSTNDPFIYEAYDSDDNEVKLPPNQHQSVYNFVKDLYDIEQEAQTELKNQF